MTSKQNKKSITEILDNYKEQNYKLKKLSEKDPFRPSLTMERQTLYIKAFLDDVESLVFWRDELLICDPLLEHELPTKMINVSKYDYCETDIYKSYEEVVQLISKKRNELLNLLKDIFKIHRDMYSIADVNRIAADAEKLVFEKKCRTSICEEDFLENRRRNNKQLFEYRYFIERLLMRNAYITKHSGQINRILKYNKDIFGEEIIGKDLFGEDKEVLLEKDAKIEEYMFHFSKVLKMIRCKIDKKIYEDNIKETEKEEKKNCVEK